MMQAQQIELLYQHSKTAMLAATIAAASIFFVFLDITPAHVLASWCAAFALIYLIRYVETLRYFHNSERLRQASLWHRRFVISSALAGLLWGVTGFVLIPEGTEQTRFLLYTSMTVLYACALSAAALSTYTVKLSGYFAFALPCLLPMGIGHLFSEHEFIRTTGLLILIFTLFLIMLALRINRTLTSALQREIENERLLAELQEERDKAAALAEQMETLSTRDSLTGIANRRHFDAFLEREWQRAVRFGEPLSLIIGDLDYFKSYNDIYGHVAGDECLRQIAQILHQHSRRASDLSARFGGEEFAIVLANTDADAALRLAESMRYSVASLGIPHEASEVASHVTMSFGIATIIPRQYDDRQAFIHGADNALYEAKAGGRDRISEMSPAVPADAEPADFRIEHWNEDRNGPLVTDNLYTHFAECGYRCQIQSYSPETPVGRHAHIRDEINLILNGEVAITVNHRTYHLQAGDYVRLPAGLSHEATVGDSQSLRMLIASPINSND